MTIQNCFKQIPAKASCLPFSNHQQASRTSDSIAFAAQHPRPLRLAGRPEKAVHGLSPVSKDRFQVVFYFHRVCDRTEDAEGE
jgi:hypothetical protein